MLSWFRNRNRESGPALRVDIHSHLIPGIDDGVQTPEDAEAIIRELMQAGYERIITTPHIMSDAFRNTPEIITAGLQDLRSHLRERDIHIDITAAAEYYLDEALYRMVEQDEPLLTFGDRYLLFETNFMTEPLNLKSFIFLATTKGYKLVLAHPERYLYLHNDLNKVQDLIDRGVTMQMNISSLTGYYSRPVQQMAFRLVDRSMIHWLGTDAHHLQHARLAEKARQSKHYRKALALPLLNNSLL